jgi:hypothetical protein
MLFYSASIVYCVDNYCHVFSVQVKYYSETGMLPVHETAHGEMPAIGWRFPFSFFAWEVLDWLER